MQVQSLRLSNRVRGHTQSVAKRLRSGDPTLPIPEWWRLMLKAWMARNDVDQVALAARLGISGPAVNGIVNRATRSEWVTSICRITGLPSPVIEAPPEIQEIAEALKQLKPEALGEFRRAIQRAVDDAERRKP
jgi:hypothetical protein